MGHDGLDRSEHGKSIQIPLWTETDPAAEENADERWPLDPRTRECGRRGVLRARKALEHRPKNATRRTGRTAAAAVALGVLFAAVGRVVTS